MLLVFLVSCLQVVLNLTRPLSNAVLDVIYRIILGRNKPLPPVRNKILLMSATELADSIRKKKISAEEVMRVYISRIRDVNSILNACVDQRFEMAMADAKAVDKMLESGNKSENQLATELPLLGVPFTCKEMIGVKGLSQTNGLLSLRDRKSPSDAEVVEEYKKAGAIPVVVTNVPTLSMWWETFNPVYGRTINPYDNRRTTGGSSGGEAAILTAAGAVIGIGNDLGGSIRLPSAFCGVYGHKTSRGVISNQRPWPVVNLKHDPFWSTGPMCRYVQDLKLLVRILSGKNAQKLRLDDTVDFSKVKIYYMEEIPGLPATSDVKACVRKAVDHFQATYSISATKLHLEDMRHALDILGCKLLEADGPPLTKALVEKYGKVNLNWEILKSFFKRVEYDLPILFFAALEKVEKDKHYYEYLQIYEDLRQKMEEVLSGDSILLFPTHPEPAPHILTTIPKFYNVSYTCLFNVLGYAATNIPAGLSDSMPIGLQAIARQYQDHLTLATAVELDKVFNGWNCPGLIDI